ncbi:hypothetical protein NEF87_001218 [Candidatus Lokiarchaeum ossiferum]|uniref:Uncharacterized protein n=1 Tax=Candidatus Lokiarchaeum ossiferum TaxID=2951803 RepID=A0ABY6HN44_9ARCH|nr:hypothetical protein NEF87_001218 [Candidatus Lokiarchaeum sp. B-35]
MSEINNLKSADKTPNSLNHDTFVKFMASNSPSALINDHNAPLAEMVHPLTYSMDFKKHPDMLAIPVAYSFQRNFYKLFKELKKLPY